MFSLAASSFRVLVPPRPPRLSLVTAGPVTLGDPPMC